MSTEIPTVIVDVVLADVKFHECVATARFQYSKSVNSTCKACTVSPYGDIALPLAAADSRAKEVAIRFIPANPGQSVVVGGTPYTLSLPREALNIGKCRGEDCSNPDSRQTDILNRSNIPGEAVSNNKAKEVFAYSLTVQLEGGGLVKTITDDPKIKNQGTTGSAADVCHDFLPCSPLMLTAGLTLAFAVGVALATWYHRSSRR